jgi:hypothetical protein
MKDPLELLRKGLLDQEVTKEPRMITAQTARLIAMQINSRRLEEARASWFFLLSLTISDSATYYSFR